MEEDREADVGAKMDYYILHQQIWPVWVLLGTPVDDCEYAESTDL